MLEGISTFEKTAGFIVKHAGTMIRAIGRSVRLLPAELVDTFYYYETNYGYVFANLRQKIWHEVKHQDLQSEFIRQKYAEWKKEKCLLWIKNPSEKEKKDLENKTFIDVEIQSNLLTNKSLSVLFKISGLFCVIYGVPTCAIALSIVLSYKGLVSLTIGVAAFVFGHDFTVAGQVLREYIDKNGVGENIEKKEVENVEEAKALIGTVACRSWFYFNCRPEEINFKTLKEEVDNRTYLLSVIIDNIAKIWNIKRTKTIMSLIIEKIPRCCCRTKKVKPLIINI